MALLTYLKSELSGLLDLLLPPTCAICRAEVAALSPAGICPNCLTQLLPLPIARCPRCALPYPTEEGGPHLCEACLRQPPDFSTVVAVGLYGDLLRESIHRFKYEQGIHLDHPLGALLAQRLGTDAPEFFPELILPVPLHPQRLRERGYNQSLLLARRLGKSLRVPTESRRLQRVRPTPPQQGLPLAARQRNLRGAFALSTPLRGEKVLLIDDVMTTGATVRECAQVLKSGGAGEIIVAVLGRAPRHH
ncbi:MAG: ComF family protein [Trichloromonas sp.]|jgi:ComF family protein|nr:ComF family protein [Trichloromonas sp.]